jgi:hypothetical protein
MVMYSFVPPFREAKVCGMPSCVFDKLGCTAGVKRLRNVGLESQIRHANVCVTHSRFSFSWHVEGMRKLCSLCIGPFIINDFESTEIMVTD